MLQSANPLSRVSSGDDISRLVEQASKEMDGAADLHRSPRRHRANPQRSRLIVVILFLLIFAACGHAVLNAFLPPSIDQVTADLQAVIVQAQTALEEAYASQGRYPDALPVAALAAVVMYVPTDDGYRLSVTVGKVEASLESDGSIRISKGSEGDLSE